MNEARDALRLVLKTVGERRQEVSRNANQTRRQAQKALQAGNKDQAAIYDASAVCFYRVERELGELQREIENVTGMDSDGLDEWVACLFDENGSHADPLAQMQTDSYDAAAEFANNARKNFPMTQLRIVLMRIM